MSQALYRKYRPKKLREAVGQAHITDTLAKAIKSGRISHAYLFTGPRGVGKTSVARILAHEINGLPYTDDSTHLDIIEIDAASNRRIDEIRDLRERVNIAPTSAKYKVYIIDEVHMLTREAFNALLKTLEEPPAHVVFILATTEAHKLPETIVSRTQRFTFKPVPFEAVAEHLRTLAKQEKIQITDDALALIAEHGEGSFRDSISLLDQASGLGRNIDADYVRALLGIPPAEAIASLQEALQNHEARAAIAMLADLREQGYQPAQIARRLGDAWRAEMATTGTHQTADFTLLEKLLNVPGAHDPERYLEIVLLEFALAGQPVVSSKTPPVSESKVNHKTDSGQRAIATPKRPTVSEKVDLADVQQKTENKKQKTAAQTSNAILDESIWAEILAALKQKYNTLYGVARLATPTFRPGEVELAFTFAFHRKRLSESKNQEILAQTIEALTGQRVAVLCTLDSAKPKPEPAVEELVLASPLAPTQPLEQTAKPAITTISNIFGGGELLNS